jgi:hypothetical protein
VSFRFIKNGLSTVSQKKLMKWARDAPQRGKIAEITERTLRRMIFLKNLSFISSDFPTQILPIFPTALELESIFNFTKLSTI